MKENKKPIRKFFHSILNIFNIDGWILLKVDSALQKDGWFQAFKTKNSTDNNNNPLPWVTYPFIDFIDEKINNNMSIFEFGSGNSTFYYAMKVKSVIALEHNKTWFDKLSNILPSNVDLFYKKHDEIEEYSKFLLNKKNQFDIIIIDGVDRNNCIYNSITSLKSAGIVVLDDSERDEYKEGINFLFTNNFKELKFWGMAPGILFKKCTSIFYKHNNCLNI